jgi:hypothetical protein
MRLSPKNWRIPSCSWKYSDVVTLLRKTEMDSFPV